MCYCQTHHHLYDRFRHRKAQIVVEQKFSTLQLSPISDCIIPADVQGSKYYWGTRELHEFNLQ